MSFRAGLSQNKAKKAIEKIRGYPYDTAVFEVSGPKGHFSENKNRKKRLKTSSLGVFVLNFRSLLCFVLAGGVTDSPLHGHPY